MLCVGQGRASLPASPTSHAPVSGTAHIQGHPVSPGAIAGACGQCSVEPPPWLILPPTLVLSPATSSLLRCSSGNVALLVDTSDAPEAVLKRLVDKVDGRYIFHHLNIFALRKSENSTGSTVRGSGFSVATRRHDPLHISVGSIRFLSENSRPPSP